MLAKYAFAHEELPFADFDAVVYGVEEAWSHEDARDEEMTRLLSDWGLEPDAGERAGLEERIRRLLREAT